MLENKLLGIILNNPDLWEDFSNYDNCFKNEYCKRLYDIMHEVFNKYNKINKDLILDYIKENNLFDIEKFYEIYDSECFDDNYKPYLIKYITNSLNYKLKDYLLSDLKDKNYIDIKYDIEDILNKISNVDTDKTEDMKKECQELVNNLKDGEMPKMIYSGLDYIDENQRGFGTNWYVLYAATESTGKTSLIINFIPKQLKRKLRIGVISCETLRKDMLDLIACNIAGVDTNKVINRTMQENEKKEYLHALEYLYEQPLFIEDRLFDWFEIKQKIKMLKKEEKIDIIYIDYLHYIRHKKMNNMYDRLEEISKGIKTSCQQLNIPHVCIAILNKEGDTGEPPKCRHIKGNNDIQYDADVIVLLKTFKDNIEGDYNQRIVDFYYRKNKYGKRGFIDRYTYYPFCRRFKRSKNTWTDLQI